MSLSGRRLEWISWATMRFATSSTTGVPGRRHARSSSRRESNDRSPPAGLPRSRTGRVGSASILSPRLRAGRCRCRAVDSSLGSGSPAFSVFSATPRRPSPTSRPRLDSHVVRRRHLVAFGCAGLVAVESSKGMAQRLSAMRSTRFGDKEFFADLLMPARLVDVEHELVRVATEDLGVGPDALADSSSETSRPSAAVTGLSTEAVA